MSGLATAPKFDPSQPFDAAGDAAAPPAFDPSQPFHIEVIPMDAEAMATRGMTAGASDYVGAAGRYAGDLVGRGLRAAGANVSPQADESYNDALKGIRAGNEAYRKSDPVKAYGAEIAGGVVSPLYRGVGQLVDKGTQALGRGMALVNGVPRYVGYGLQGAGAGALAGAGNAEGKDGGVPSVGDLAASTAGGAAGGAALGVAIPALAEGGTKLIGTVADALSTKAPMMTQAQIKAASTAGYKAAEDAGVIISPSSFADFADKLPSDLKGYHPTVTTGAANIVKMLQDEAAAGPLSLEKLDSLRSVASGASVGKDPNEARIAGNIVGKIDDYIHALKPDDLVPTQPAPGQDWYAWRASEDARLKDATEALTEARSLWRANAKLKTISNILDTAENLDDPNYVKNQFRAIIRNPRRFGQFTSDEQDIIKKIGQTGTLDALGKLAPSLDTLGVLKGLGYVATSGIGGPGTAVLPTVGLVAKPLANGVRANNLVALQDLISSRGAAAPPPTLSPRSAAALATLARTSPAVVSPFKTGSSNQ